jgi:hypothetical protein
VPRELPRYDVPQARPMAAAIAYALHAPSLLPAEAEPVREDATVAASAEKPGVEPAAATAQPGDASQGATAP